ncbi:IS3 family transposase [Thermomonospora cellulosilytica]|uniref:IS3 family transposase n=1 Tax=Thermomonospora cellulosilytica TaxID=1411118 RepID=UPI0035E4015B
MARPAFTPSYVCPGKPVNRKRVERLMRAAGIQGLHHRKERRNLAGQAIVAGRPSRSTCHVSRPQGAVVADHRRSAGRLSAVGDLWAGRTAPVSARPTIGTDSRFRRPGMSGS